MGLARLEWRLRTTDAFEKEKHIPSPNFPKAPLTIQALGSKAGSFFLFLLLLAVAILALIPYLLWGLALHLAVWLRWFPQGKRILLVYSHSPLWQDYLESRILPHLGRQGVILNWSERKKWERRFSLPVLVFHYFGGRREFNPLAVVFRPCRWAKIFRFWQPFREFKHGKSETLEKMTAELLEEVRR
ncbi:MAG: hypothetical protein HY743_08935 [Deltaproteobacteria bacterium]|nr:hypothetical protein [Deltaproteobacteria bacterium]